MRSQQSFLSICSLFSVKAAFLEKYQRDERRSYSANSRIARMWQMLPRITNT